MAAVSSSREALYEDGFGSSAGHVTTPLGQHENDLSARELAARIATVALPQLQAMIVGNINFVTSIYFVGQLHDTEMIAALGLCNVVMNILGFSWIWGTTAALGTLCSQAWGAGDYHGIGVALQRGIVISVVFTVLPLALVWLNADVVMERFGQPPEVVGYVGIYGKVRVIGLFSEVFNASLQRTLSSIGNTRLTLVVVCAQASANIALQAMLVPRLQFTGVPIALATGDVVIMSLFVTLASRDEDFKRCWPGFTWKAFHDWLPYLYLAIPSFVLLATEGWAFGVQDFFAGLISTHALATNAILPYLAVCQYAIGGSLSVAATTVVGNLLGEGLPKQARRAGYLCVGIVFPCILPSTIMLLAFTKSLAQYFTEDEVVVEMFCNLLPIVQLFCIFDSHQAALTGVLAGAGKQAISAPLITVSYWIVGLPVGLVLAFGFFSVQPIGLGGLWYGMLLAVILHVLSFGVAVLLIDWERTAMEVKERVGEEEEGAGGSGIGSGGYELVAIAHL